MCGFVGVVNFSENLNNEIKIQSANDLMIKKDLTLKVIFPIIFLILVSEGYLFLI